MDRISGIYGPIAELAKQWVSRGKVIKSLQDLLQCYFNDFKIICIPAAKSFAPSLVKQQYQKLHDHIRLGSESSLERRQSSGLLMSAEELENYFEYAFDHFRMHPKAPFNFRSAALSRKPVTTTFKNHICKLTIHFMACYPDETGKDLFRRVAPLVASCIFLSAHRSRYPEDVCLQSSVAL